jgi:hypothetical protein
MVCVLMTFYQTHCQNQHAGFDITRDIEISQTVLPPGN